MPNISCWGRHKSPNLLRNLGSYLHPSYTQSLTTSQPSLVQPAIPAPLQWLQWPPNCSSLLLLPFPHVVYSQHHTQSVAFKRVCCVIPLCRIPHLHFTQIRAPPPPLSVAHRMLCEVFVNSWSSSPATLPLIPLLTPYQLFLEHSRHSLI